MCLNIFIYMKALVGAFNKEEAPVGALGTVKLRDPQCYHVSDNLNVGRTRVSTSAGWTTTCSRPPSSCWRCRW